MDTVKNVNVKHLYSGNVFMGICGEPTNLSDSYGEELFVGDLLVVFSEEHKNILNMCGLEYVVNDSDSPFIMGLKGTHERKTEYYLDGDYSDETNYDYKIDYYVSNENSYELKWLIKKVKGYESVVNGECWGSGLVTAKTN